MENIDVEIPMEIGVLMFSMEIYGEISMEFHGNWCPNPPWNSMENFTRNIKWMKVHSLSCSAKTLPHFYLISECFLFQYVFFLWRVDYAIESSMFWLSKCDFSRLFNTERSWHAYWFPVVFEFLIGMICPLMQKHFLWPLSKRKALSCGSARLWGPSFLSKVSQDLNN